APERDVLAGLEVGEAASRLRQEAEDAQGLREASPGSNDPTLQLSQAAPDADRPGLSHSGDLTAPVTNPSPYRRHRQGARLLALGENRRKRGPGVIGLWAGVFAGAGAPAATTAAATKSADAGFKPIFDGKTLTGWHVSKETGHGAGGRWVVENGA